jgi:hypothetical protein
MSGVAEVQRVDAALATVKNFNAAMAFLFKTSKS